MKRTVACVTLLALAWAAPGLYAQVVTGSVTGSVVDTSGSLVPGASLKLISEASGGLPRSRYGPVGQLRVQRGDSGLVYPCGGA